ncbi:MAG TPA: cation diffusion facilitator family transporter [Reyranella sp.]|nr:cation diffusion facilitator family transporter [Reyranella sp.]
MDNAHALPLAEAGRLMRRATVASMAVAVVLIAAKLAAWVVTDSVAMLSSLVDSALDLVSSLITFFAVRQALTPADAGHRFGHGKAEALAGMTQAGFIAASALGVLLAVGERLRHPRPIDDESVGIVVSAFAVVLTLALVSFQKRVMRRTGSLAVTADRTHYFTDMMSNVAVGVGLFLSSRLGEPLIDIAVAVGVAGYLLVGSLGVGRKALDVLMDHELPEEDRRRILAIAHAHPEVKGAHDLRTRSGGLTKFIQLHIELEPTLSFVGAHAIGDRIEAEIEQAFPGAEIILHVDPVGVPERHPRDPDE